MGPCLCTSLKSKCLPIAGGGYLGFKSAGFAISGVKDLALAGWGSRVGSAASGDLGFHSSFSHGGSFRACVGFRDAFCLEAKFSPLNIQARRDCRNSGAIFGRSDHNIKSR